MKQESHGVSTVGVVNDMATADTSALSGCVPCGALKSREEDWIPKLDAPPFGN